MIHSRKSGAQVRNSWWDSIGEIKFMDPRGKYSFIREYINAWLSDRISCLLSIWLFELIIVVHNSISTRIITCVTKLNGCIEKKVKNFYHFSFWKCRFFERRRSRRTRRYFRHYINGSVRQREAGGQVSSYKLDSRDKMEVLCYTNEIGTTNGYYNI